MTRTIPTILFYPRKSLYAQLNKAIKRVIVGGARQLRVTSDGHRSCRAILQISIRISKHVRNTITAAVGRVQPRQIESYRHTRLFFSFLLPSHRFLAIWRDDTAVITFRAVKRSPFATTKRRSLSHVARLSLSLSLFLSLSRGWFLFAILMPRCLDVYI